MLGRRPPALDGTMKRVLLLLFSLVLLGRTAECGESSKPLDGLFPEIEKAAAAERAALKKAGLVSHRYQPQLIIAADAVRVNHGNPLAEAKTPAQRRFLREYFKVQAEGDLMRERPDYQWVEPLRRCGVEFPPGARIIWLAFKPPLVVIHTPKATRQIEKYRGLQPHP